MLPENTHRYLQEVARVTKSGMRGYLTFFLLTEQSLRRQEQKKTAFRFPHVFDGYRTLRKHIGREGIVAWEQNHITAMVESVGLRLREIRYGSWSTDKKAFGDSNELFQDLLLVGKD